MPPSRDALLESPSNWTSPLRIISRTPPTRPEVSTGSPFRNGSTVDSAATPALRSAGTLDWYEHRTHEMFFLLELADGGDLQETEDRLEKFATDVMSQF